MISLGLIVAISGAALGSGAFTSVEADRGVSVNTAGDANAYLAITPGDGYDNSGYIYNDSDGTMTFNLGDDGNTTAGGGEGFNKNATTTIDGLIKLENQGNSSTTVGFGSDANSSTTVNVTEGQVTFTINTQDLDADQATKVNVEVNTSVDTSTAPDSSAVTIYAEPQSA